MMAAPACTNASDLIDVLGAGDDPHEWRNLARGLDDTQADVGVRHRDDEVSRGIEPGRAQDVWSRGVAKERLLSALLEFKDNVDICFEDDGIDLELREQARDRLPDRPIADDDRAGIFLHTFAAITFARAPSFSLRVATQDNFEILGSKREHPAEYKRIQADRDNRGADHHVVAATRHKAEGFRHLGDDERKLADLRETGSEVSAVFDRMPADDDDEEGE